MPRPYYKPSDLDPPILKGEQLGFSPEEIAAALGVPLALVIDRITAAHCRSMPLPAVRAAPREAWRSEKRPQHAPADPRRAVWKRASEGAKATRQATEAGKG